MMARHSWVGDGGKFRGGEHSEPVKRRNVSETGKKKEMSCSLRTLWEDYEENRVANGKNLLYFFIS